MLRFARTLVFTLILATSTSVLALLDGVMDSLKMISDPINSVPVPQLDLHPATIEEKPLFQSLNLTDKNASLKKEEIEGILNKSQVKAEEAHGQSTLYGAFDSSGELIGGIYFKINASGEVTSIEDVILDDSHQKKLVTTAVIKGAISIAQEAKCKEVRIIVGSKNQKLRDVLRFLRFQNDGKDYKDPKSGHRLVQEWILKIES